MNTDLSSLLPTCLEAAQAAGRFQMQHFRSLPNGTDQQKAVRELVSFVDVESEEILKRHLVPLLPEAGFYGEESGQSGSQELVWIVDPLDGTTNYLSGMDYFSVSLALVQHGQPLLGVVHRPATGETFHAIRHQGLYHNGELCRKLAPHFNPSDALFATGFPYRSPDLSASFFGCAAEVLTLGRGIRRLASAALDVSQLSAGWLQGFWESDLQPYDIAAAILFMQESGCHFSNHLGTDYDLFNDRLLVAAHPDVHADLQQIIQRHYATALATS